jgi:hypothetical protein
VTKYQVPICVCGDPIDTHDPKTGKCMGQVGGGCGSQCTLFVDSGRRQTVEAT